LGYFVMAGLVPAIHFFVTRKDVDARHKAGHDGEDIYPPNPGSAQCSIWAGPITCLG
jgi:hypothetical protein